MQLRIDPAVVRRYPDLHIAVLIAEGLDNRGQVEALRAAMQSEAELLRARFDQLAALLDTPPLAAWQRTYRAMGLQPKKVAPASVSLARRAYKSGPPPALSPAVDAYLLASLRHLVPIGGHDLDTIVGDIVLRGSCGGEPFVGIGGDPDVPESTLVDELVYADVRSVLTRHWNHRDCERAKISASTTRLVLMAESADVALAPDVLATAIAELGELLAQHCGARCRGGMLDARRTELELA